MNHRNIEDFRQISNAAELLDFLKEYPRELLEEVPIHIFDEDQNERYEGAPDVQLVSIDEDGAWVRYLSFSPNKE